jgi:hypothetical protein
VVAAHGGVYRVLVAYLGFAMPASASSGAVGQGCVYVFSDGGMSCYE